VGFLLLRALPSGGLYKTTMKRLRWYHVLVAVTVCSMLIIGSLGFAVFALASRSAQIAEPTLAEIEAQIGLSPTYGGANTLVNITGIGYPENARIALHVTGVNTQPQVSEVPQAEGFTDEEGQFSVMMQIPEDWPDGQRIQDEELLITVLAERPISETNEMEVVRATRVFDYQPVIIQPEISLSVTRGPAEAAVTVESTGFPVGEEIVIRVGPRDGGAPDLVYAQGTANEQGQVAITFNMPENWPDGRQITEEQLEIIAVTSDGEYRASAGFDYEPVLYPTIDSFSPNYGSPGTVTAMTGSRFRPGAIVQIHVGTSIDDASGRAPYMEVMADIDGRINTQFTMPGYWPGGMPIRTRNVIVLATAHDGVGYGWAEFAYLDFSPEVTPTDEDTSDGVNEQDSPEQSGGESSDEVGQNDNSNEDEDSGDDDAGSNNSNENASEDESQVVEYNPVVVLLLDEAAPGESIEITGSGFPANTIVTLKARLDQENSVVLGTVQTDYDGAFVVNLDLPEDLDPMELDIVAETDSPESYAESAFTVVSPAEEAVNNEEE